MATTVTTSKKFRLKLNDWEKALLIAIGTPVATIIINSLNAGLLVFNWKNILITGLSAGLAYIVKNFLTPAQIVIKDAPPAQVNAVNAGEAKAQVVSNATN